MPRRKLKTKKQRGGVEPVALTTILLGTVISGLLSFTLQKLFSYKKYLNATKSYEEVLFVIQKNYESSKQFTEQNLNLTNNLIRNTKIEIKLFENALISLEDNIVIKPEELNNEMKQYEDKVSEYSPQKLLKELDNINSKSIPEYPCKGSKIRTSAKGIIKKYCEKGTGEEDIDKDEYDKPILYEGKEYCCEDISADELNLYTVKRNIILSKINEKKTIEDEIERLNDELSDFDITILELREQLSDYTSLIQAITDKIKDLQRLAMVQINIGDLIINLGNQFKKEGIDITKEPYTSKFKDKSIIEKISKKVEEEGLMDFLEKGNSDKLKKQKKKGGKFSPEVKENIDKMDKLNKIAYDIFKEELLSLPRIQNCKEENNSVEDSEGDETSDSDEDLYNSDIMELPKSLDPKYISDLDNPSNNTNEWWNYDVGIDQDENGNNKSLKNKIKELESQIASLKLNKRNRETKEKLKTKNKEKSVVLGINKLNSEIDRIRQKSSEKIKQLEQRNIENIRIFEEKEKKYKKQLNDLHS